MENKNECSCQLCKNCCWNNPGWFGNIKEIADSASIMNMDINAFCKEYLIKEYIAGGDDEHIVIPAPRRNFDVENKRASDTSDQCLKTIYNDMYNEDKLRNGKGFIRASWGHNLIKGFPCIFLDILNNMCVIHNSKPRECRESYGCKKTPYIMRECLLVYWQKHQDFIESIK